MVSANQNIQISTAELWLGESISKSSGLNWPAGTNDTRPLAHSINIKLQYKIHLMSKNPILLSSNKIYITASKNLVVQTFSAKLLEQPNSFEKAQQLALEFSESVDFLETSFKQTIKKWTAGPRPQKGKSKLKLGVLHRKTYAIAAVDPSFEFILGLEEEFADLWQINLNLKNNQPLETEEKFETNSEFKNLGAELKYFLSSLSNAERNKIPKEYQTTLLWYIEDLEKLPHSIGGWNIEKTTDHLKLSRWHIISENRRVAAQILAEKIGQKWIFKNLTFVIAKTHPKK